MKPKAIFSSLCRVQLLKFFCLGVVMAMISSPTSAAEFKTGQQLIEEGYRVMEQHELEAYLINRTVYTQKKLSFLGLILELLIKTKCKNCWSYI